MKRLLKIDELDNLQKKRSPEEAAAERDRPVKQLRTCGDYDGGSSTGSIGGCSKAFLIAAEASCTSTGSASKQQKLHQPSTSSSSTSSSTSPASPKTLLQKLVELLDSNVARDVLWWLPGKKGRGFALNRKIFEHKMLKVYFRGQTLACFLRNLNRWGFRQVCNPSLPENVIAFEKTCFRQVKKASMEAGAQQESQDNSASTAQANQQQQSAQQAGQEPSAGSAGQGTAGGTAINIQGLVSQQQPALFPTNADGSTPQGGEELMQSFVSVLWLELQRQLSTLLLQSSLPFGQSQQTALLELLQERQLGTAVGSTSSFIRQQTIQQQRRLRAELSSLHQQQLSNLTYQIVALVAANMDQQQQGQLLQQPLQQQLQQQTPAQAPAQDASQPAQQQPTLPLPSATQRIVVKYLIALVLLRLQHQQQYLGSLRQERMTALAVLQSIEAQEGAAVEPEDRAVIGSLQVDQLLAETATLSLWRAQQLLAEAAELAPPRPQQEPPQQIPSLTSLLSQQQVIPAQVYPTQAGLSSAEAPAAVPTVH